MNVLSLMKIWYIIVFKFAKTLPCFCSTFVFSCIFFQVLCFSLVNVQLNYIDLVHYIKNTLLFLSIASNVHENKCVFPFHSNVPKSRSCCSCWLFCAFHRWCTILKSIFNNDDWRTTGWLKLKDVHVKWLSKWMTLFGLMFP